jgi:hypothetical protein
MHTKNLNAAHSLYVLFETLSDENQQLFLQELVSKQKHKIELLLKQSHEKTANEQDKD